MNLRANMGGNARCGPTGGTAAAPRRRGLRGFLARAAPPAAPRAVARAVPRLARVPGRAGKERAVFAPLALAAALVVAAPAGAADLRIEVTGLDGGAGVVRLSLYDRPEIFPEKTKGVKINVPAKGDRIAVVFADLDPGRYAIALFHDEDGDDEFDKGFLGLPLEGYGFSNDARPFFGPPSFEAAAVALGAEGAAISVRMVY